eukprot:8775002-Karenia_brevis.AAC.1
MAAGSAESRASGDDSSMDATVNRLMETKTEVSTGELKSEVEEGAPNDDAEAATNASGLISTNAPGTALTQ